MRNQIVTDTYVHPPSDPDIAAIVTQLSEGLPTIQQTLEHTFITGACLQQLSHFEPAAVVYAMTLDVDPDHTAASYRLAECLIALGKLEEAIPFLNKTIELSYGDFDKRKLMELAQRKLDTLLP
ncbi:MAG: hypothetical protein EBV69_06305 [Oxalobacteraceae bacterium]|nr:hypothetical protein [Oxalobacteraceae bacterium]